MLLAVELALLLGTTLRNPRLAAAARIAIFIVPLVLTIALRSYLALASVDVLEWDETYYLSMAVTAADGRGLYPYVFGYGEMAIMGGLGYVAYVYALAVQVAGPTILALRAVSLVGSTAALLFVWLFVRRLYGSGSAWMAAALVSSLRLFDMSNSARMDGFTFAWVTASLLMVAVALDRPALKRRHLAAGLCFGLGLQVHLDTAVTAAACGLLYLVLWLRELHAHKRLVVPAAMLSYAGGWGIGAVAFIVLNVLPDPQAFYKTTALRRVDATGWYSGGTTSLFGSFLDPRILLAKESARYAVLLGALHWLELLLAALAALALAVRRRSVDLGLLVIIGGVLIAAAIVLNNASPLYFLHVAPALVIPMAPLFSHGLTGRGRISTAELSRSGLVGFAIVISALCAVNGVKRVAAVSRAAPTSADAALVKAAHDAVPRHCRTAGDGALYVRHFADYPYFISARPTEVAYAMLFHGVKTEGEYWEIKSPGAVVMREPLSSGLSDYLARHQFTRLADGVWISPAGCATGG